MGTDMRTEFQLLPFVSTPSFFLLPLSSSFPSPLSPPPFLPLLSRFDTIPLTRFTSIPPPSFSILFNEIRVSWVGILLVSLELREDAHVARGRALVSGPF